MDEYKDIGALRLMVKGHVQLLKNSSGGKISRDQLIQAIDIVLGMSEYKDNTKVRTQLIEEAELSNKTWMESAQTLHTEDGNWHAWLEKARPDIKWRYWERYETSLLQSGWPDDVVTKLGETTDETLSWLNSPNQPGRWDRRGMVVGSVQSGKTANYTGLICKAADAGYKIIIILAGFHNNLRSQTQIRLEEGFLGYYKKDKNKYVRTGVGFIEHDAKNLQPDSATSRSDDGDFNKAIADRFPQSVDRPIIFVIKKNASVLNNLIEYLENQAKSLNGSDEDLTIKDLPLLLIDDEADQGSINTNKITIPETTDLNDTAEYLSDEEKKEQDPTTINGQVRKILNIFEQSAYVAYTATPFANIMIHKDAEHSEVGDDLFPRSFITSLKPASNYIGPQQIFGYTDFEKQEQLEGLPLLRPISDYAASLELREREGWMPPLHDKSHIPIYSEDSNYPNSLYIAVLTYILSCSARALRGQGHKHSSMLVHVTRLTDVQHRVFEQVKEIFIRVKQSVIYGAEDKYFSTLEDLKNLWEKDFIPTTQSINKENCPLHTWDEISEVLPELVQTIKIREINGSAGDVLDYERHSKQGLNVIAIGGDKLSRGLTLEGLLVSYFTRQSKMYDTLMQMGRWFGYRDGYVDLTRLFGPQILFDWFRHISDADIELRSDFETMCAIGSTPENFGHRVRTHPQLQITSPVKMRYGSKERCSFSGDLVQTILFKTGDDDRKHNLSCLNSLIEACASQGETAVPLRKSQQAWSGVSPHIVTNFLESYKPGSKVDTIRVNTTLIAKYITAQQEKENLTRWTVLISGKGSGSPLTISSNSIGAVFRRDKGNDPKCYKPGVITDPKDELIMRLGDEAWDKALKESQKVAESRRNYNPDAPLTAPKSPQLRKYRSSKEGLLIIYPIDSGSHALSQNESNKPFVGIAVSFPGIDKDNDIPVEYVVNSVGQQSYGD
ncbi:Z1 domain-containing protein [uncultured Neptuniibacter sp.]|uniref:Z1 domain-containing protein n=1 Tax=uncultured Neptuniibacter sp. TaxID=502143 RepID=UPI0026071F36|nr:Z1 domain-containing protein [uncultured Neptuniibacter sp.]